MAVTISKTGPYFSSGQISFSALRNAFKSNSGVIKASELRRDTNVKNTNPVVPDATENSSISSNTNLKVSQFRNSIKYYDIIQTGSDSDISFHSTSYWNGNQGKNIVKKVYIEGTMSDSTYGTASCRYRGDIVQTYNLGIIISGKIYGLAGLGGGQSGQNSIDGGAGGSAIRVVGSIDGTTINVEIKSGAAVWAGGGGGGRGKNGDPGTNGVCRGVTAVQDCGTRPSCPDGYFEINTYGGQCCESYSYCCGLFNCACEACSKYIEGRTCAYDYEISGGMGGSGGLGGNGLGWGNFDGSTSNGLPGGFGQEPTETCGYNQTTTSPTRGKDGTFGANGGDWGQPGFDAFGRGGPPGYSIFGKNFSISGSNNIETIKGIIDYNYSLTGNYPDI